MKDNFSINSGNYAKYRPDYPPALFDFLYPLLKQKEKAWDCGTGSGQVARELALDFKDVEATDSSSQQIKHAYQANNINYSVQHAEHTNFRDESFDLITVGQAIHWFDFDSFNNEVKRLGKANSVIAIFGYELSQITPEIDHIIKVFYTDILGKYWTPERIYLQQRYQNIPFPFRELETPEINNIKLWRLDDLLGYLNTWSAVQQYNLENKTDSVSLIEKDLRQEWGNSEVRKVNFPIMFRAGRIK